MHLETSQQFGAFDDAPFPRHRAHVHYAATLRQQRQHRLADVCGADEIDVQGVASLFGAKGVALVCDTCDRHRPDL